MGALDEVLEALLVRALEKIEGLKISSSVGLSESAQVKGSAASHNRGQTLSSLKLENERLAGELEEARKLLAFFAGIAGGSLEAAKAGDTRCLTEKLEGMRRIASYYQTLCSPDNGKLEQGTPSTRPQLEPASVHGRLDHASSTLRQEEAEPAKPSEDALAHTGIPGLHAPESADEDMIHGRFAQGQAREELGPPPDGLEPLNDLEDTQPPLPAPAHDEAWQVEREPNGAEIWAGPSASLAEAGETLAAPAHDEAWKVEPEPNGAEISEGPSGHPAEAGETSLIVSRFEDFGTINKFAAAVRSLPGVESTKLQVLDKGTLHLSVQYEDSTPLSERLRDLRDFTVELQSVTPERIEAELANVGEAASSQTT